MSRRPSPVTARPTRPWRGPVIAALLLGAGLVAGPGGPVRAADATVSSVLDRAFVDAAFVDRPGGTPDLLTLALDEATFGLVHVDLLRRDSTWAIEAEAAADLSASFDGGTPWLVQLGAGSFEIIAATNDQSTLVTHIRVAAGALTVDPPIVVGLSTNDAGAADVNGDGALDLVLAGYIGAGTTDCPPSAIAVVSGLDSTLVVPPADRPARRDEQCSAGRGGPRRVGRRSRPRSPGQRVRDLFDGVRRRGAASPGHHPAERWGRRRGPRDLSARDGHRGPVGEQAAGPRRR